VTAPFVSAAITTWNRAAYLPAAVESVLQQTYRELELVVVDDGSTDETNHVLEPYLDRLRLVTRSHGGRAAARNAALEAARGSYISFLDSDDLWTPDKLERLVPVLEGNPAAVLVHGHVEIIDATGQPLARETAEHRRAFSALHAGGVDYAAYALRCLCFTSATVMRREAVLDAGGYDPEIAVEDLDLYLRLALTGEIVFVEGEPVARYRLHGGQTPDHERTAGETEVCLKHLRLIAGRPGMTRARRNLHLTLARCAQVGGDRGAARRALLAALRLDPRAVAAPGVPRRIASLLVPFRGRS
jgi:glycosyltransferase involved in cell wall biosynthesis